MKLLRTKLAGRIALLAAVGGAAAFALFRSVGIDGRNPKRSAAAKPGLVFNESIEPILSENCYACHGPDPGGRKAGLRLDRAEFALAAHGKDGPAIIPGDPAHSPLIQRVELAAGKEKMPPVEAHKFLTPDQVVLLRRWVSEGAQYQDHWSFIAPRRPKIPTTKRVGWARNPIDSFILARLEQAALEPSPEADKYTLIRRVTLDLTGLPPSPGEVRDFVADTSPGAYEHLVDRLLASPHYGEHRAHYWLDVARYGDTHGLHLDNYRSIWPYRDYVISAYNRNKPFDQFIREQLAGDLLPPKEPSQIVATGYVRAGVSTGEGGVLIEELRVNYKRERTEAYGAAFLGLTVGCAVCHDHKFDPTTQQDFYRLSAFFNNLAENPFNGDRRDWPPFVRVPTPGNRIAYERIFRDWSGVSARMADRRRQARELVKAWLSEARDPPRPVSAASMTMRLRFDEGSGAVFGNSAPVSPRTPARVTALGQTPVWGEGTWFWPAMRFDMNTRLSLPAVADWAADRPFSLGVWLLPHLNTHGGPPPSEIIFSKIDPKLAGRGWELSSQIGKLSFMLVHRLPGNALRVETRQSVLQPGRWDHICVTYDGSGRAKGVRIYVNGSLEFLKVRQDALAGSTLSPTPLEVGRRLPETDLFRQIGLQDLRFYDRSLSSEEASRLPREDYVAEIAKRPMASWSEDEFKAISDFYFTWRDVPMRTLAVQLPAYEKELNRLGEGGDVTLVCKESGALPYADVLTRGVYNARVVRVSPGVPHFLPPLPPGAIPNRLALADWTVSPSNPLTARVSVNRMWSEIFGTGIVATTEDFGLMGARPSEPELLDWLAVDFRESGWNVKRFYKQLVMSATYRQSARVSPELLAKDPGNRLLARGPRFRMDAEMLRDSALSASGLLVDRVGGPSVQPYQPQGVWEAVITQGATPDHWVQATGEGLYRRSLYTFWKRQAIVPNLEAFNAPLRDSVCTRRDRTDTPLQALVLWNDPQWLEAARVLAQRALEAGANGRLDPVNFIAYAALARPLQPAEREIFAKSLADFEERYREAPGEATKLLGVGESKAPAGLSPTMLAAYTLVASELLSSDEALNK